MSRSTVPARVLDKLLKECATHTTECERCVVGPVQRIEPDETGCNWKVSKIQGSHCVDCLSAMADFIAGLREQFLLAVEDEMDTLITTWTMR